MSEKEENLDHRIEFIDKVKKNNILLKKLTEGLLSELIDFNVIFSKLFIENLVEILCFIRRNLQEKRKTLPGRVCNPRKDENGF